MIRLLPTTMPRLLLLALAVLLGTAVHAQSFQGLGDLPGADFYSYATGVSADGSVVVGAGYTTHSGPFTFEAFRWTAATGMVGLGDLPGSSFRSIARGVSADGSVVVGEGRSAASAVNPEAFRWTEATGMVGLGDLAGGTFQSVANAVSADGSVAVGNSRAADDFDAFRWTSSGGMVAFTGSSGPTFRSDATGVSADGTVVVGYLSTASRREAFRWSVGGGMVNLGPPPGWTASFANAVTPDGQVVVGELASASERVAFRWTQDTGFVSLGSLPGAPGWSSARAVSADGHIVVGVGGTQPAPIAAIWTEATGLLELKALLTGYGLDLTGWTLSNANGVSADGQVIVGDGINPDGQVEAWRALLGAATTTTGAAQPGDVALAVANAAAFAVGRPVTINPGGPNEESGTVAATGALAGGGAAQAGTLTLASPLRFAHASGEAVVSRFGPVAGEASVSGEAPLGVAVSPNPARERATVTLTLATSQVASVAVVDVLGRRVALLHDGPLGAGPHHLSLDAARLPAGVYVVRATTATATVTQRLTVVR